MNFAEMLATAKAAQRSVPICLRGDLVAAWEEAEAELESALKRPADSLAGSGSAQIAERIAELEQEMAASIYHFRFEALPPKEFRAVIAAHPPRRDADGSIDDRDRGIMANYDTILPALVRACLKDPQPNDEQWAELEEKLSDRQWADLYDASWFVNRGEVNVPFSQAASRARLPRTRPTGES